MICHLCVSMSVEDENHFLLECLAYTYLFSNNELSNILAPQNYGELGALLLKIFEHRNNILK